MRNDFSDHLSMLTVVNPANRYFSAKKSQWPLKMDDCLISKDLDQSQRSNQFVSRLAEDV